MHKTPENRTGTVMENLYNFTLNCKTDRKNYSFSLESDGMVITEYASGDTFKIPRTGKPLPFKMTRLPFLPVMLTIIHGKKLVFRLTDEQADTIALWSGPLNTSDLAQLLSDRYKWLLPVSIILIIVSFPVIKETAGNMHDTVSGYMNLGLGLLLLLIYILSKSTLSRIVFFLDFIWFIAAGIVVSLDIVISGKYLLLILVPLLLLGAWSGLYEFNRFKGVK